jgi:hypothetical protein
MNTMLGFEGVGGAPEMDCASAREVRQWPSAELAASEMAPLSRRRRLSAPRGAS